MRKLLLLIIFILPLSIFSQDSYLANLPISGGVSEIGVSPSERIWIATKAGNTYYTDKIGELWHIGPFGSFDPYNISSGKTFERINFFDENTLMISGFIQEGGKQDFVFRSTDKGITWDKVKFGKSSWIDAAYINDNGKAWMSGNSQLIYYTENKGETWKSFDKAGNENALRFATIHFAKDEKTGLFGSFWNVLYKTTDNCITWERLATPLDQKKYKRLSKEHRPDIRKIRVFGDYYIINQQGNIFYTKNDDINWIELPNIADFETTPDDSIYLIDTDLKIDFRDSSFVSIWKSDKQLKSLPVAVKAKNKSLFAFIYGEIYKINQNDFIVSKLMTNEVPIREPYLKVNFKNEEIGFDGNTVLRFDKQNTEWYRFMELPINVSNAVIFNNQIVVADNHLDQRMIVDIDEQKTIEYELPKSLFNLSKNNINKFSIEIGSQGCFHSDKQFREYQLKKGYFKLTAKGKQFLSKMDKEINPQILNEIVSEIDNSRFKKLSINDLEISKKDLENFKNFIDKEEQKIKKNGYNRFEFDNYYSFPGENTDFEFYKNVADRFETIPDSIVNEVFNTGYGNWSTTTDWRKITIEFKNGDILTIENSDDKPNYLYTPWIINFNGLIIKSNSLALGHKINELTEGDLYADVSKEKKYAIYKVADFLYKQTLSEK
ncbi:YCF48-related protein [Flavivirga abyssicola]|uniref:WD40/YVTN/BNR-like repeat-containing protein n=1 Tax=Flavivirga abyssicola TaxID=3063533 RepID=UPI0026DF3373|nr:YCF48-related protein [Flavivirga sp. MEBiC07777]WVK14880.1 YCF48-related protein [Flavivirga sp. MEBiC07777]